MLSFRDWGRDCHCEPGQNNTCGKRFSQQFGKLPFGYDHKYVYSHIGYNLKATDMQASIGVAQLKKLPEFIKIRKRNFSFLYECLKKYEEYFVLPQTIKNSDPSWFGFPLLVKKNSLFSRDEIVKYLEKNKIATRMLFGSSFIRQPAYENVQYRVCGDLGKTNLVTDDLFWIGVYPGITKEKMDYMIETIDKFFEKKI